MYDYLGDVSADIVYLYEPLQIFLRVTLFSEDTTAPVPLEINSISSGSLKLATY